MVNTPTMFSYHIGSVDVVKLEKFLIHYFMEKRVHHHHFAETFILNEGDIKFIKELCSMLSDIAKK